MNQNPIKTFNEFHQEIKAEPKNWHNTINETHSTEHKGFQEQNLQRSKGSNDSKTKRRLGTCIQKEKIDNRTWNQKNRRTRSIWTCHWNIKGEQELVIQKEEEVIDLCLRRTRNIELAYKRKRKA